MSDQTHHYTPGCGCLFCADHRAFLRRTGWQPQPARDWRGEPLPSADEWAPLIRVDLARRAS